MLHTVIVSYKRYGLTARTLESYLSTVTIPHRVVIVDNGSPDNVTAKLAALGVPLILLGENRYQGYAVNRGWERAEPEARFLQRSDNDALYLPGWCDDMLAAFDDPSVGQYGPIAEGDEEFAAMPSWPVGGNSIIRRELYDAGLRYDETPWPDAVIIEEHQLTLDVWAMGYRRVFGSRPGVIYLDDGDDAYNAASHADRGLPPADRSTRVSL